jgi:hypothetical protein
MDQLGGTSQELVANLDILLVLDSNEGLGLTRLKTLKEQEVLVLVGLDQLDRSVL